MLGSLKFAIFLGSAGRVSHRLSNSCQAPFGDTGDWFTKAFEQNDLPFEYPETIWQAVGVC